MADYLLFNFLAQGQDGVDLEMNINGAKYKSKDDDFSDLVCAFFPFKV